MPKQALVNLSLSIFEKSLKEQNNVEHLQNKRNQEKDAT